MPTRMAVAGAAGKMGRRIIALAHEDPDLECVAAVDRAESPSIGRDAGELAGLGSIAVPVAAAIEAEFDVLVEFSLPEGSMRWLQRCRELDRPMVTGTTGHTADQMDTLKSATAEIPVLHAPNMSVGINVILRLTRLLAETLDDAFDAEILEAHHRFKVDAPSGTAIALRDAVIAGRTAGGGAAPEAIYGRKGETGGRPRGEIGVHALRLGDTVGEHTVSFGSLGETITIGHTAHSRDTFAAGAILAAKWILGRPPGRYDMQDVLFGAGAGQCPDATSWRRC